MASPATTSATRQLLAHGQSVWLDYIRRDLMSSGRLRQMVDDGWITGMTSNPTIFEKAISGSTDYNDDLRRLAADGLRDPYQAFVHLAVDDIRAAADTLRPVYDRTGGKDGFVSLEVPPGIEFDVAGTVAEVRRLFALADRPNVMIKIPGTVEGATALQEATAAGVNVNMTLLFAFDAYERAAQAYIAGLETRLATGQPIDRIASVASFFVSRVDTAVDAQLPEGSPLRGKAAVANARKAYGRFRELFSGPRWERLAAAGAQVQRPLWASTGTKNPAYSDILYVEDLIAPDTVNTMPEATLKAVLDHLEVRDTIVPNLDDAYRVLAALAPAGVNLGVVTDRLLVDGLASFEKDFVKLLDRLRSTLALLRVGKPQAATTLGPIASPVEAAIRELTESKVVERVFAGVHTVWKPDPTEISNRLGWIPVIDQMRRDVPDLEAFAQSVAADGYTTAVVLGMGGSSLAPEVFHRTFGTRPGMLDLKVLDTTVSQQILDVESQIDVTRTLFVVASKSGGTIETLSHFAYFWEKVPDGAHFMAITDAGTSLDTLAVSHNFRRVFRNRPDIGGRYSALSYFGLVPAALIGADVGELLDRAAEMRDACGVSVAADENPAAWLGAAIGIAAKSGRDKLTFVMPDALSSFGFWLEQLVAESTGKEGRGIVPIEGESLGPSRVYGDDRLFVGLGNHPQLDEFEEAGHPVVRIPFGVPYQLGAEMFRWEMATAIAGHILAINPFDQPNVQEAKDATARILGGERVDEATMPLEDALAAVRPGDYIAITAYVDRDEAHDQKLQHLRTVLRDRYRVATTVGYGPRFLHSTGQLHKGGPNTGVFIQVVESGGPDLPIPGREYSFAVLNHAQALGDLAALTSHGRRVARTSLAGLEATLGRMQTVAR
jgi:transaldolase / glucose-6-phosphate isomerase